jgi:hypothetical protein
MKAPWEKFSLPQEGGAYATGRSAEFVRTMRETSAALERVAAFPPAGTSADSGGASRSLSPSSAISEAAPEERCGSSFEEAVRRELQFPFRIDVRRPASQRARRQQIAAFCRPDVDRFCQWRGARDALHDAPVSSRLLASRGAPAPRKSFAGTRSTSAQLTPGASRRRDGDHPTGDWNGGERIFSSSPASRSRSIDQRVEPDGTRHALSQEGSPRSTSLDGRRTPAVAQPPPIRRSAYGIVMSSYALRRL